MKHLVAMLIVLGMGGSALAKDGAPFDEAAWQQEFSAADKDGDGRLSREEALAANPNLGDHFNEIDADGDGFISPAEDRAMLERSSAGKSEQES